MYTNELLDLEFVALNNCTTLLRPFLYQGKTFAGSCETQLLASE